MAVEIHAVHNPIQAKRFPANILKVPMVPVLLRFPSANSAITSGIDHINKKINHGIKKVPPPFAPTILGNRQMFPVPIAAPIEANINPRRPLNSSDFCIESPQSSNCFSSSSSGSLSINLRDSPSPPHTAAATTMNSIIPEAKSPNGARYGNSRT